jgi:nitrogen-specific signal transduction histidine kinase
MEKELYKVKEEIRKSRIEHELSRLDGLNLVGEVAAGIGHENRNSMTTVRGFLQLLSAKEECSKYNDYFVLF